MSDQGDGAEHEAAIVRDGEVPAREGGRRRFHHPRLGRVERTQVTLLPSGLPDHKLVLLLPEAGGPGS